MEKIAHRGAKLELPENTVAAFRRAFERGADAIELDVHASRDGVIVVHHDPVVRRLGAIRRQAITELDSAELHPIELAPGIGIPTLAEVLEATPADKTVYVEIKGTGIAPLVASAIGGDPRCVVHSFDYASITAMRELDPAVPRGILFEKTLPNLGAVLGETGARDVWPQWKLIDRVLVEQVHEAGGRVIAWTVNDAGQAARLARLGVDGICSDDVRLLA